MKLIRSTKCSLKFCTAKKQNELLIILSEYSKVVNIFIDYFWLNPDRRNRLGEVFLCLSCGHRDNADVNAGKNILNRFLTGLYGARYKEIKDVQVCADLF